MANCGADTEANSLITSLTQDAKFPIPVVDLTKPEFQFPDGALNDPVSKLSIEDVTTGSLTGPGAFDTLMRGFRAHLEEEFNQGRITGDDYTKAYIALTESAMNQSIAFLLGKDGAYWQAQQAQIQAFIARVQLEETKVRLAATQFDASNQKANYALTKMRMITEEVNYCSGKYTLEEMMPLQKAGLTNENAISAYNLSQILPKQVELSTAQIAQQKVDTQISDYNLSTILPAQNTKLVTENAGQVIANDTASYNLSQVLPAQLQTMQEQRMLVTEQKEAQRAQTKNNRSDGELVEGVLGKQKDLYNQQINSYQRDSELKVAKVFSDAWITQKTIDEGLVPPTSFTNQEIEKVLSQLRTKAGIGV